VQPVQLKKTGFMCIISVRVLPSLTLRTLTCVFALFPCELAGRFFRTRQDRNVSRPQYMC